MTVVRYTPGTLRAVVAPSAVAMLGEGTTDAAAEAVWQQLTRGAGLAGVVDALAAGGPLSSVPPFAVALDEDGTWRVAVRGPLTVLVGEDGGRVDGAGASTWTERSIRSPQALTLGADPDASTASLPLRDGVVAASVVVAREEEAAEPADPASPSLAPREPVQPHSVAEVHDGRAEPAADPAPEPVSPAVPAPVPATVSAPVRASAAAVSADAGTPPLIADVPTPVAGTPAPELAEDVEATIIRGTTDEPSDDATITLAEARAMRASGQLPPVAPPLSPPAPPTALGLLRVSTGQSVLLDRTVIVGRRPRSTRMSGADLPHLIAVDSPQQDISRNHLEVRVEGDSILATDLDTTNGTTLLRRGSEPVRLHPSEATIVVAGDVLDLGDGVTVSVEDAP
jgi:hypothetical protein